MHHDKIRNLLGGIGSVGTIASTPALFMATKVNGTNVQTSTLTAYAQVNVSFDSSRIVPTGNYNSPRAFGVLVCVYLGA